MNDALMMKRVLRLAAKASGMTSPNPMVGALLVKNEKIIAEDFHKKPGTPHAEALVIQKTGAKAKGTALYVNLEPCCHTEKLTPPCTKAIIESGIKKVILGMKDPNPKVFGRGIKEMENAGIKVVSGVLEKECVKLNEAYIKYITKKIPFVTMKVAMTLDGKIATPEGESKWITGEKARQYVHNLRSSTDAVMTAIGTIKADDPQLTSRIKGKKDPVRIIIDPRLDIPIDSKILITPPQTIIVASSKLQDKEKKNTLLGRGVRIIEYEEKNLDLKWLMNILGELEISSVMIEGGSSLNSHALEDGIVDKIMFFIAPKIIGGKESFTAVGGKTFRKLSEAYQIKDINHKTIGEDILIEGYIN
ncbi:MAG: bifunctional diaminohydroxyphosphoribosylaminopyrimidine deaminase/5-amino-6-(5-phosphoribosylamino)uracil reductase RibD [Nitrospiraceae bacterium]|nr:bifunctional diaminohydroxyphosphoribosylaminopyrimidine deaminase/5-amino-6-(5-phosphoribosylamino)uracil reductase RibD [Nitrospiraceae bacterium]